MDRNSLTRWILIAAMAIGGYYLFYGKKAGDHPQQLPSETYVNAPDFAPDVVDVEPGKPPPAAPPEGRICRSGETAPSAHGSANHLGSWLSSSCWSSPTHTTWPSGRSSAAGTSSSSLTSTTWSIRSPSPPPEPRSGRSRRQAACAPCWAAVAADEVARA